MSSHKLAGMLRQYEEDLRVRYSPRTGETYLSDLRVFLSWLALRGVEVSQVRTSDLLAYQGALYASKKRDGKLYALPTQAGRLGAVRHFFRFLYRRGFLLLDPGASLEMPRLPVHLPRVILTLSEVRRILVAPDASGPLGLRDRAILETLYGTGIRASELTGLTLEDVDTEERILRVVQGKGRRDRNLPLTRAAADAIEAYLVHARPQIAGGLARPQLFLGGYGAKLQRASVALIVKHAASRARIKKPVTAHTFRHTVATHLLKGHADIRHIQALLGHRSLSTTQRYTRVEISDLKRVLERSHPRGR